MMSRKIARSRFAALALALGLAFLPGTAPADQASETAAFTRALAAADAGKWDEATALAANAGMPAADVIEWEKLRAGKGTLAEYVSLLARRPSWPDMWLVRKKGEAQLDMASPARVIAYFAKARPRTAAGAIALVNAYDATGQTTEANATALRAWTTLDFKADEEKALLATHPELEKHDVTRLYMLLSAGNRGDEVKRLLPHVSTGLGRLALARVALQENQPNSKVEPLINRIPARYSGGWGLAYDRFVWRMRHNLYYPESTLMIEARSKSAASLGSPEKWSYRRLILARYLMRTGQPRNAYRVAASNHLRPDQWHHDDLEFLAGFIALTKLHDPKTALVHFRNLPATGSALATTRRNYWIGRAYDALNMRAKARAAYLAAAKHQIAYYGLLSAEKLGMPFDAALLSRAQPSALLEGTGIAKSSLFQAAVQLARAHDEALSGRFIVALCLGVSTEDMGRIAGYSLRTGAVRDAVLAAKVAAARGVIYPAALYPVPAMIPGRLPVTRALALGVARRESEFDPGASSGAGAKGLMQLMPSTARQLARQMSLSYSTARLTADPAFNVKLGSEYLKSLVDRFGPSLALIASGYNAGPNRAAIWIRQFGDPRSGIDPVDWVETIPFDQTRTYVKRLTESVVIYRAILRGRPGPVRITQELTGK